MVLCSVVCGDVLMSLIVLRLRCCSSFYRKLSRFKKRWSIICYDFSLKEKKLIVMYVLVFLLLWILGMWVELNFWIIWRFCFVSLLWLCRIWSKFVKLCFLVKVLMWWKFLWRRWWYCIVWLKSNLVKDCIMILVYVCLNWCLLWLARWSAMRSSSSKR